jgi:hypothetical protein
VTDNLLSAEKLAVARAVFAHLPDGSRGDITSGVCATAVAHCLTVEAYRELSRPLDGLLASRSVCFLRPEPPLIYPSTDSGASELWSQGAGFAIQHLEQRNAIVNVLCGLITEREECLVTASLYVSRLGSTSMSEHIDAWDAWLLQLVGTKAFMLRHANRGRLELAAGDWVFLPSGVPHAVSTPSTLSIHLSVNLHRQRKPAPN